MKKNDILLCIAVALYSYLFYAQSAGINFILFTIALTGLMLIKDPNLIRNKPWIFTILGSIASGVCVLLYGNLLSVIANIISLGLAASYAVEKNSSLLLTVFHAIYSYASSLIHLIMDLYDKQNEPTADKPKSYAKLFVTIIPIAITFIFFFIYREINPIFMNFTNEINFNFITFSWFRFTIIGLVLMYSFFHQRLIPFLIKVDHEALDNLSEKNLNSSENQFTSLSNEKLAGILLFSMLNLLLFIVNILDVNYIYISPSLPEGITYSEYIHQGIGMLIISIMLAVAIILFFFRGNLNFEKQILGLKILAYIWIAQNMMLIATTIAKNSIYVSEYSLTYKRIGVYVYLLLCLIGLLTTFIKIIAIKSNWFLFRKNAWAFYSVLIINCTINWDILITNFNIHYSRQKLDKSYLLSLSESTIPTMLTLENKVGDELFQQHLNHKISQFRQRLNNTGWQSWNLEDRRVYNFINELDASKQE